MKPLRFQRLDIVNEWQRRVAASYLRSARRMLSQRDNRAAMVLTARTCEKQARNSAYRDERMAYLFVAEQVWLSVHTYDREVRPMTLAQSFARITVPQWARVSVC